MDNTEKVEKAINDYLETEDASFLEKIKGTVSTEPFGDTELGYCIARGDLSDIISRIKKITNFSELLPSAEEQLELDDKIIVDKDTDLDDTLVTHSFSDEGEIGNELTDGLAPEDQLTLDDKVLICKDSLIDENDQVVAEFSDLNFSEVEDDTAEVSTLDKITEILNIAKELDNQTQESEDLEDETDIAEDESYEEDDSDVEDYEDDTEEDDDSDNYSDDDYDEEDSDLDDDYEEDDDIESFSNLSDTFSTNLSRELNFDDIPEKVKEFRNVLVNRARDYTSEVRHQKTYADTEKAERNFIRDIDSGIKDFVKNNIIHKKLSLFSESDTEKTQAELDLESANKRLEEGKNSDKGKYIQDQLDIAKSYKGSLGGKIGGSEEARKIIPELEAQKKALASGKDEEFLKKRADRAKEEVEKQNKDDQDQKLDLEAPPSTSINASFIENLKKEVRNRIK